MKIHFSPKVGKFDTTVLEWNISPSSLLNLAFHSKKGKRLSNVP